MMQYLVILLDDTSVSFCHYSNDSKESNLMPIETLKAGIVFAMKENLNIQFVYPCHKLPQEYLEVIDRIDHTNIQPACRGGNGEVIVLNDIDDTETVVLRHGVSYVLRIDKFTLFSKVDKVCELLQQVMRLNVVITTSVRDNEFYLKALLCFYIRDTEAWQPSIYLGWLLRQNPHIKICNVRKD